MRYCLYCGKKLNEDSEFDWHKKCIYDFFGTYKMPEINLNIKDIEKYMRAKVENNESITGIQEKISLHLEKENNRLTVIGYPVGYILKLNTKEYPFIAEAEHLVMSMANASKIETVKHGLIKINNTYVYITKRVDRSIDEKLHMEDFCQLSNRPTEYKYQSSYEKCEKIIDKYSNNKNLDTVNLFELIVFSFITCNSDMHLKNFSLIENINKNYLSPAYDLLPVNIILPKDEEETAITINDKKKNITKNDLLKFASTSNISEKVANNIICKLVNLKDTYISMIDESLLSFEIKNDFKTKLVERINRLI